MSETDRALVDALAPNLYVALMEVTADSWRQWRYLTPEAQERHRVQAAQIVADALMPTVAALMRAREYAAWGAGYDAGDDDGYATGIGAPPEQPKPNPFRALRAADARIETNNEEVEYAECTCGHYFIDHGVTGCEFAGCGCSR